MRSNLPSVSIIIPRCNEEKFIGRNAYSLIRNNYPKDSLEILIYNRKSIDRTRKIVKE